MPIHRGSRFIPTPVGRLSHAPPCRYRHAVHPHACGEIYILNTLLPPQFGSSPRLWGDWCARGRGVEDSRFIPTPVGRFWRGASGHCPFSVHPHACGEIASDASRRYAIRGSSPRLWGDSDGYGDMAAASRFIPTPVGRLTEVSRLSRPVTVHPHACGEIEVRIAPFELVVGSSPRLWGD